MLNPTFQYFLFFVNDRFILCVCVFVIVCTRDVISPKFTSGGFPTREKHLPQSRVVWFAPPPSLYGIRCLDFTLFCSSFSGYTQQLLCPVTYLETWIKFLLLHLKRMSRNVWVFWANNSEQIPHLAAHAYRSQLWFLCVLCILNQCKMYRCSICCTELHLQYFEISE